MKEFITSIKWQGEFLRSVQNNVKKLEDKFYSPEELYLNKNPEWPGDWTGRALLAMVSLHCITGKKQKYFDELFAGLKTNLNKNLYFGRLVEEGSINEQQLAGNSWFLRAMCLFYEKTGDSFAKEIIYSCVEHLYSYAVSALNTYPDYIPVNESGGKEGCILSEKNGWLLSTDVGCLFICLDGLSTAYAIFKDGKTAELIEKLYEKLKGVDIVGCCFQTHATLTAMRGLLQYYKTSKKADVLVFCEEMFEKYFQFGMTANYANYNWFKRPLWTEPCGIVDSFMIAKELYRITKEENYAIVANKIYYNALRFAERENGGFGCDRCCNETEPYLFVDDGAYDAFWCCSMRGSEGLRAVADFALSQTEKGFDISLPLEFIYDGDGVSLKTEGNYPFEKTWRLRFTTNEVIRISIFIPYATNIKAEGCAVEKKGNILYVETTSKNGVVTVQIESEVKESNSFAGKIYEKGLLLLGKAEGELSQRLNATAYFTEEYKGETLIPIPFCQDFSKEEALKLRIKVVFA